MLAKKLTSVPMWTMRQKGTNGKFSSSQSGYISMYDNLVGIKELEHLPGILLPGEKEILTSGHLILEITSEVAKKYGKTQNQNTITFPHLLEGVRHGDYPKFNSIIPPVFGYYGADQGGLISNDANVRAFAHDLLEEALLYNIQLKKEGLGQGVTIIWPAYMSFSALECKTDFLVSNDLIMSSLQWKRFQSSICEALIDVQRQTDETPTIHLEWKTNDPGIMDIFPTLYLAMEMAKQINNALGWTACFINNEWAHLGLAGTSFIEGTNRTIEAELFDRLVHVNGGTIHTECLEDWMKNPFHPADWPGLMDPDWPVGYGPLMLLRQQEGAIRALAEYSASTGELIILEHDVFHAPAIVPEGSPYGQPGHVREPADVLVPSVVAANAMWQKAVDELAI